MQVDEPKSPKLLLSARSDLFNDDGGLFEATPSGAVLNRRFIDHIPLNEGQVILLPYQIPQAMLPDQMLGAEEMAKLEVRLWVSESHSKILGMAGAFKDNFRGKRGGDVVTALWDSIIACKREVSIDGKLVFFITRDQFTQDMENRGLDFRSPSTARSSISRATRLLSSKGVLQSLVESKGRFPQVLAVTWPLDIEKAELSATENRKPQLQVVELNARGTGARVVTNQMRAMSAGLPVSNIDIKTGLPARMFESKLSIPVNGRFVEAAYTMDSSTALGHMVIKDLHAVSTLNAMIVHEIFKRNRTASNPSKLFSFTLNQLAVEMGKKKDGVSLPIRDQVDIWQRVMRSGHSVHLFTVDKLEDESDFNKHFDGICKHASSHSLFTLGEYSLRQTSEGEVADWFVLEVDSRVYEILRRVSENEGFRASTIPPATYFEVAHTTTNALSDVTIIKLANLCLTRTHFSGGRMSALNLDDIADYFGDNEGSGRPGERRDRLIRSLILAHEGTEQEREECMMKFRGTEEAVINLRISFLKILIVLEARSQAGKKSRRTGVLRIDYCTNKLRQARKAIPEKSMLSNHIRLLEEGKLNFEEGPSVSGLGGRFLAPNEGQQEMSLGYVDKGSEVIEGEFVEYEEISDGMKVDAFRARLIQLKKRVDCGDMTVDKLVLLAKQDKEALRAMSETLENIEQELDDNGLDPNNRLKTIHKVGGWLWKAGIERISKPVPQEKTGTNAKSIKFTAMSNADALIAEANMLSSVHMQYAERIKAMHELVVQRASSEGKSMMDVDRGELEEAWDELKSAITQSDSYGQFIGLYGLMSEKVGENFLVEGLSQNSGADGDMVKRWLEWAQA